MRYLALACDYDGTIAASGILAAPTIEALGRLRASGRKLILVTGRELPDLMRVCPRLDLFDRVVAENGALLYRPAGREEKLLTEAPSERLIEALRRRDVRPLSIGHAIVSTCEPNETVVIQTIRDLGLELHVVFNKGAVMVLPSGVNKATGLTAALDELSLSPHNCVGVGDAENDHAFLALCEAAVVVDNALPALKERADLVTAEADGAGVAELVERLLASDLAELAPRLARHAILLGRRAGGDPVHVEPYGASILVAGASGSGKSTFAVGFIERLAEQGFQFCVIDPEGDYPTLGEAVTLGTADTPPTVAGVVEVLAQPRRNAIVNLVGLPLADRPGFFESLLPRLEELRARAGHPHWIVIDEAHHLLPAGGAVPERSRVDALPGLLMVTVHPELVAPAALEGVEVVVGVGDGAERVVDDFCRALGIVHPRTAARAPDAGDVLAWLRSSGEPPFSLQTVPGRSERRRHVRKYAQGELGEYKSFYFRGPEGKLNLRAQNLAIFVQLAEGVDDETWLHHLGKREYSAWFRRAIKDEELAAEAAQIEAEGGTAAATRAAVRHAIEQRYTLTSG
ncbi:MAG: HAD hydrolase family protein [Candidatus Rokuibacteriota bacterium]